MKTNLLYTTALFMFFSGNALAQKTQDELFNAQAEKIKNNILHITQTEKEALKTSIDSVNTLLQNDMLSYEEANQIKDELAQKRAIVIENKVTAENKKLSELVKSKAQGEVKSSDDGYVLNLTNKGFELYTDGDTISKRKKRTHFDVLIAFGHNNLVTESDLPGYNDNFSCNFFEWGGSFKTKLSKNNNLLNLRYGVSFMHNYASPKENYIFSQNKNVTEVVDSGRNLSKNKFANMYIAVPVHLEFNFGKSEDFRVGLGGFVGYNLYSEQRLKYRENGRKIKDITRKDWNVNDVNYGLSAYLGYGIISLYAKYDLNPVFRNNSVEQHNLSIGIRLDM